MTAADRVAQLEALHARRKDLTVRQVKAPNRIELIRVGWHESAIANGWGTNGGYSRDVEVVRWFAWADDEFCGGADSKKGAIRYAQLLLDLADEEADR